MVDVKMGMTMEKGERGQRGGGRNRGGGVSDSLITFHIFSLICILRLSERGIGYVIFVLSISANVMVDVKMGRSRRKGGRGRGREWGGGSVIDYVSDSLINVHVYRDCQREA